jgi:hypothetical protein
VRRLAKSTASQVVLLKAYLSTDHVSDATSKTIAVTISKNGAAFGNPNAGATNATEISGGWYKVTLDATDTSTNGDLVLRGTATGVDNVERVCVVDDQSDVVTAIWANVITGTTTAIQAMRGFIAALLGKASGLDTNAPKYRDVADTKNVISATTDASGNRTAVTLDLT